MKNKHFLIIMFSLMLSFLFGKVNILMHGYALIVLREVWFILTPWVTFFEKDSCGVSNYQFIRRLCKRILEEAAKAREGCTLRQKLLYYATLAEAKGPSATDLLVRGASKRGNLSVAALLSEEHRTRSFRRL